MTDERTDERGDERGDERAALAVIEVLDRDGSVRHSVSVRQWPLRVGRALDNELVLDDLHTAAHHFSVAPDAQGQVLLTVGDCLNGVQAPTGRLAAGQQVAVGDTHLPLTAGRTHLRLRLASHTLAPEQVLQPTQSLTHGLPTLALLALAVVLSLVFSTYLESDPEVYVKALGSLAIYSLGGALGWAGVWTLLSKVFTRQGHFGWHLRVLLVAALAWQVVSTGGALLAFAFSLPSVTDFVFAPGYLILGAMLFFHLQAVEPHHAGRTRGFAIASVVMGIVLSLWFNVQGSDRLGSELYMNHLFPPALRVSKPVELDRFMQDAAALQATLDAKAKKDAND